MPDFQTINVDRSIKLDEVCSRARILLADIQALANRTDDALPCMVDFENYCNLQACLDMLEVDDA